MLICVQYGCVHGAAVRVHGATVRVHGAAVHVYVAAVCMQGPDVRVHCADDYKTPHRSGHGAFSTRAAL